MADEIEDPVKEPAEKVAHDATDTVAETVPDPVEEVTAAPDEDIHKRIDSLSEKVDSVIQMLSNDVDPTDDQTVVDEVTDMPGDGHEIKDESPAKLPWTHRKPRWFS